MSVINQMLKDLDERQQDGPVKGVNQKSLNKPLKKNIIPSIAWVIVILVAVNIAAWFIWQLSNENNELKQQLVKSEQQAPSNLKTSTAVSPKTIADQGTTTKAKLKSHERVVKQELETPATKVDNTFSSRQELKVESKKAQQRKIEKTVVNNTDNASNTSTPTVSEKSEETTPASINKVNTQLISPVVSTLSIKRKQLTAQELAEKNYQRAEQALQTNNSKGAEKWFEEVLLVLPEHKQARKQLAALWFGRQHFNAAQNLLSQGVALYPQDIELRLMKTRIYLKQGLKKQALATMLLLADTDNVEYQALLAVTAQELKETQHANKAYYKLTQLEPAVGKWWLGLAVTSDKSSDFEAAKQAYKRVIKLNNISDSALAFARSRIKALGE